MQCLDCRKDVGSQLTNEHLLACSGLTLQEYALRHHLPLDMILSTDQINQADDISLYRKPGRSVNKLALDVLAGLEMARALKQHGEFTIVSLGIRRLEQLLWYLESLCSLGFQFRQEYTYEDSTHRVIAKNSLKIPSAWLASQIEQSSTGSFLQRLSILVAHIGEIHAGYLFIDFPESKDAIRISDHLERNFHIHLKHLDASKHENGILARCKTRTDSSCLLSLVKEYLENIPVAKDRFFGKYDQATVVKELVFDSAHFITDHPGKCANLHGGRYAMRVKVRDQIDPLTGFVVDYGHLKQTVSRKVIAKLDHQTLNYVTAGLSWRSSTELLTVYIWENLIEYLPGLTELQIFETDRSYCSYTGPKLHELQKRGQNVLLDYFSSDNLGKSGLRWLLHQDMRERLKVIG